MVTRPRPPPVPNGYRAPRRGTADAVPTTEHRTRWQKIVFSAHSSTLRPPTPPSHFAATEAGTRHEPGVNDDAMRSGGYPGSRSRAAAVVLSAYSGASGEGRDIDSPPFPHRCTKDVAMNACTAFRPGKSPDPGLPAVPMQGCLSQWARRSLWQRASGVATLRSSGRKASPFRGCEFTRCPTTCSSPHADVNAASL